MNITRGTIMDFTNLKKTCLGIRKTVLPEVVHKGNLKSSVLWTVSKHGANFIDCTHCNCDKRQELDLQIYITHKHKTDKAIKCLVTPHALSYPTYLSAELLIIDHIENLNCYFWCILLDSTTISKGGRKRRNGRPKFWGFKWAFLE